MFTHLHLHTEYSLLDATTRLPDLIAKLQETGMKACAITDHGNMYGAFKFQSMMKEAGLKPIIGCEIYVAPRGMQDKEAGIDNNYNHLILLAKNFQGYSNLMKIVSTAYLDGFYYKPRIDFATLSKYTDGLICSSACLAGPVARPLMNDNYDEAKRQAVRYSEIFKDNFYIEVQRNGMDIQDKVNEGLIKIARELDLPIVATCDCHYLNKEDAEIQEILWCIDDGYTLDDPKRRKMPTNEFYVKTSEEMEKLFADLPEAIENTQKIADMVEEYDCTFGRVEIRNKDVPENETAESWLRKLVEEGLVTKYGKIDDKLMERANYELGIIHEKGYDNYFLTVRDFIQFCRKNSIEVGVRGSGCGSMVAYAIDITDVEPISWELYFERFLNPERPSPPDFDIDIADKRRDELIQYTIQKYGADCVKQIGTFSKLQTRQAIRDVARVLGVDLQVANNLSKMVEIVFGKAKSLDYMIEHNPEFAEIINSSDETLHLADVVRKVDGLHRGVSTHACGILITPEPVVTYSPLQKDSHGGGIGMTQYEMADVEAVGLMKYDFLGLRNLNILGACVKKIKKSRGEEIDFHKIDYKDKESFDLLKSGHTVGIFQMESEGMKKTIRSLKPETLEDICYILAAYRPGPMQYITEYIAVKEGKQKPDYIFDELEPVLSITNGVITYQEQVMKIAQIIGGYSLGRADILRRAMGKKKIDIMNKEKPLFIEGARKQGFDEEKVNKLWDKLIQFANYGFNKAHSASYAVVAYKTAYLKVHYPIEYMSALLEGDLENFDRVIIDLKECERLGIDVLPPDINKSGYYFETEGGHAMRFGLCGIKNVGDNLMKLVIEEREKNGEYLHLDDFVDRNLDNLGKKVIEYLIMCGAMDCFGPRLDLLKTLPVVYAKAEDRKKTKSTGQFDFFSMNSDTNTKQSVEKTPLIVDTETNKNMLSNWEKELLGIYFTGHPLDNLMDFFESKNATPINSLLSLENVDSNKVYIVGVLISKFKKFTTKKGDIMAFATLEDRSGSIDGIVFPKVYLELKDQLKENVPMIMAGRVNVRDGEKSFVIGKAKIVDEQKYSSKFDGVSFTITENNSEEDIKELKNFIKESKDGDTPIRIIVVDGDTERKTILNKKIFIDPVAERWMRIFHA